MQRQSSNNRKEDHPLIGYFRSMEKEVPREDINRKWDELMQRVANEEAFHHRRRRRLWASSVCAAALLGGLLWGAYFYVNNGTPSTSWEEAITQVEQLKHDTLDKVLLITHAHQQIEAERGTVIRYSEKGEATVGEQKIETMPRKVEYNQLIVPHGQSSRLLLADGSRLHVNAGTRVVYPSVFKGKTREIYVDGEAYVEVQADKKHPFIVKTPEFSIRVTGTAFNVNAYKSVSEAEVVLVHGSITVTDSQRKEIQVTPSELLSLYDGAAVSKQTVDAESYIAWTKGYFPLQGRNISDILQRLSLYYGKAISCDASVEALPLHGTIDLSVPLEKVLERIAKIHPLAIGETSEGYYLSLQQSIN